MLYLNLIIGKISISARNTWCKHLGDVTTTDPTFYEYQLYCKSLYASIQNFNKKTMHILKNKSQKKSLLNKLNRNYIL